MLTKILKYISSNNQRKLYLQVKIKMVISHLDIQEVIDKYLSNLKVIKEL